MEPTPNVKPTPARPPESAAPTAPKPTPARGPAADGREVAAPPEPKPRAAVAAADADVSEIALEVEGATWTVRVLGRSGRAGERAVPLILLGFWEGAGEGRGHDREATVVARTLAEIAPSRLTEALAASATPSPTDRRKPFFEAAGQARRSGAPRREGRDG